MLLKNVAAGSKVFCYYGIVVLTYEHYVVSDFTLNS